MSNLKVSELRKVYAYTLREEDLLVIALAPDDRGGGRETVAVSLEELRKYFNMSPLHIKSKAGVESITDGLGKKPVGITPEERERENRKADTFMSRIKKLGGEVKPQISSGFTEETFAMALADAKAVKETALANARSAMEEAFSKKIGEK